MKLFDDMTRKDEGPAAYAEPKIHYLNRSARLSFERIRKIIEEWFSRYPIKEQLDFYKRFRSTNDLQHQSAFFELFVHELLLRMGCRILLHPKASNIKEKRPDFLVKSSGGESFYLEAVIASNESKEDYGARMRMNTVYDSINKLDSPNFFIGLKLNGYPKTVPPGNEIRSFLAKKLAMLDPDEINSLYMAGGNKAVPHWRFQYGGWKIDFFPIPKSTALRGKPGVRPIGMQFYGFHFVESVSAIRGALIKKAKRYGDLDLPYVIAVNILDYDADRIDFVDALFGNEQFIMGVNPNGIVMEPKMIRKPNGLWYSTNGPRYTRVSAVIFAEHIMPWSLPRAFLCLYHNPWAKKKYSSILTRLPQAIPKGEMEWRQGETVGSILGLPQEWPEG